MDDMLLMLLELIDDMLLIDDMVELLIVDLVDMVLMVDMVELLIVDLVDMLDIEELLDNCIRWPRKVRFRPLHQWRHREVCKLTWRWFAPRTNAA